MKKRLILVSAVLVMLLGSLAPATASAAKPDLEPFVASGNIAYITPGKVLPAGGSGKWVVVDRELGGSLSGSIRGPFTMDYHALIESLLTQAGSLRGTVTVGEHVLKVDGQIAPLEWLGPPLASPAQLTMTGQWKFTGGAKGKGDFSALVIFIPTPQGHVGTILASSLTMTGQWRP